METDFNPALAHQVMMQHAQLTLLDPFQAGEVAEAAAAHAIVETGCTRDELSAALGSGFEACSGQEAAILHCFYRYMDEVQRTLL